jgi:hypothetical protein
MHATATGLEAGGYTNVKRGFLFGLGTFLLVGAIGAFAQAVTDKLWPTSVIVGVILIPLSVTIIHAARRAPSHRSRLHAIAGWFLGFIVFDAIALAGIGAVAVWDSGWNPFLPKDYEDCIETAAKTAKSKEALAILVSSCGSKFVGRRSPRGGYTYYDSRQNRTFDLAGPNPSQEEWASIEKTYAEYLDDLAKEQQATRLFLAEQQRQQRAAQEQAAQQQRAAQEQASIAKAEQERKLQQAQADFERRKQAALSRIAITSKSIICLYPSLPGCGSYKITATITNQSSERISMLAVGWAFMSEEEINCPTYIQTKYQEEVRLRPGDSIVMNIDSGLRSDGPASKQFHYCVKVTDAGIVP